MPYPRKFTPVLHPKLNYGIRIHLWTHHPVSKICTKFQCPVKSPCRGINKFIDFSTWMPSLPYTNWTHAFVRFLDLKVSPCHYFFMLLASRVSPCSTGATQKNISLPLSCYTFRRWKWQLGNKCFFYGELNGKVWDMRKKDKEKIGCAGNWYILFIGSDTRGEYLSEALKQ